MEKNARGFAFLAFEDRKREDAFVPPREAQKLFHGDRVEVTTSHGQITRIEVLEHRFRELVGRFTPQPSPKGRGGWIAYERKRTREEIWAPSAPADAKPGDWVRAKLTFHQGGPFPVTAEVTEVFGKELPARADLQMVASEYNLVEEHTAEAEREARAMTLEVPGRDLEGRTDLRKIPFITIDGETARDFDDAVFVERAKSGYVLWVGIADVSHYVREGTALDREARSRGTSVYFPERAFHMLPRALSENLCSLRPNEPRLAMVARMEFDRQGKRGKTELFSAVILSRRRATYNEIQVEHDAHGKDPNWEFRAHFELYRMLRRQRTARGSIDFDFPEAEMKVAPDGDVISITQRPRVDAHRLIEEFMIAANEAVTAWMMERSWPFVYRVHDVPARQALEKFQELAANVGVKFAAGDATDPKIFAEFVARLEGHPAQQLLSVGLLRSMKQAIYSATHGIHFGLASEGYTHFTSPIRRYPDLVVHRLLRAALEQGRAPAERERKKLEDELAAICEHCSYRERLAAEADREASKLKQVRLMTRHLGDEFDGTVNGMIDAGMFIQVGSPFVEGLLLKEAMTDDFYQFDEEKMTFRGARKRRLFRIGDPIRVVCVRADIDRRQIDFGLVVTKPGTGPSKRP